MGGKEVNSRRQENRNNKQELATNKLEEINPCIL